MRGFGDAAWEAYLMQQHLRSAEMFSRASDLAEAMSHPRQLHYRAMQAKSLQEAGRYNEALAVVSPLLKEFQQMGEGEAAEVFRAMTIVISIALALPISNRAIERAFWEAERFLATSNDLGWKSRLMLDRSDHLLKRGYAIEAREVAKEAWSLWSANSLVYSKDAYFGHLVEISLALADTFSAKQYLEDWKLQSDNPAIAYYRLLALSRLARLQGSADQALDWVRQATVHAEGVDSDVERIGAVSPPLVRALIVNGEYDRARKPLAEMLRLRNTESLFDRFYAYLLATDYHLASVREALGFSIHDFEYAQEFGPARRTVAPDRAEPELLRAERRHNDALRCSRSLDEILECSYYGTVVLERSREVVRLQNLLFECA